MESENNTMELKELLVFGENMILVRHDEIPDKFKDLSCNILANFMNHLSDCLKYDNPVLNSKKSVDILNVVLGKYINLFLQFKIVDSTTHNQHNHNCASSYSASYFYKTLQAQIFHPKSGQS